MSTTRRVNIHGRRGGRGIRPFLLILKLTGVAMFLGGLISLLILVLLPAAPQTVEAWQHQASLIRRAFLCVIIPGLLLAIVAGLLLAASMWRVMIRMRWFVVKIVVIAVGAACLHLFMHGRSVALQATLQRTAPDLAEAAALRKQLLTGTAVTILFGLTVTILGRVKPRLGQDYGRTFGRRAQVDDVR